MNGCRIGSDAMLAAGALLTENKEIPDRELWAGSPARRVREIGDAQAAGMQTVSYTHLDVYKRQARAPAHDARPRTRSDYLLWPVSYTHLDVYKRQVWNSAMLVYQALLLGGYAYAHWLGRFAVRRQAMIHLGLLLVAALWLPVGLARIAPPAPGQEALWVPLLLFASIGPVFFAVSAQAPLMQRWFAADPRAGDPYFLYAASNLGSFAGLISYPALVEPLLPLAKQSIGLSLIHI